MELDVKMIVQLQTRDIHVLEVPQPPLMFVHQFLLEFVEMESKVKKDVMTGILKAEMDVQIFVKLSLDMFVLAALLQSAHLIVAMATLSILLKVVMIEI